MDKAREIFFFYDGYTYDDSGGDRNSSHRESKFEGLTTEAKQKILVEKRLGTVCDILKIEYICRRVRLGGIQILATYSRYNKSIW